jgi:hypothetical protein
MKSTKTLWLLAVVAMTLLGLQAAPAASAAAKFTAGGVELFNMTSFNHELTVTGSTVDCENVLFSGSTTGSSFAEQTVGPTYPIWCTAFGFAEAVVSSNGCETTFKASTSIERATVSLNGCGTGTAADKTKGIQISVVVPFFATCVVDVPEQSIERAAHYTNFGSNTIEIGIFVGGVMTDVTTSTGFCPLTTGTHSGANGATLSAEIIWGSANGVKWDAM